MSPTRIPVFSILGVPAVAAGVGLVGKGTIEGQWRDAFAAAYPGRTQIDISTACTVVGSGDELCSVYGALGWIVPLAVLTVVIAVVTIAVATVAVSSSRGNPYRLARVFEPVLVTTMLAAVALAVLDGALIMLSAWYGEPAIIGYRHPFVAYAAGLAVAVAVGGVLRAWMRARNPAHTVPGEVVDRDAEPQLWAVVDGLAAAVGTEPPDNIAIGETAEMFVTQAEIRTLSGRLTGRTMYLSLPMARLLTEDELKAVIGHELGHFCGRDLEASAHFYPIYGEAYRSLLAIAGTSRADIVARVTLASAFGTLRWFVESLIVAERALARDRELAADRVGAGIAGPLVLASALVKLTAYAPVYDRLRASLQPTASESEPVESLGDQLVRAAGAAEREFQASQLDGIQLTHPTDSHPPLSVRLEQLGTTAAAVIAGGLGAAAQPSSVLIPDAGQRDASLTNQMAAARGRSLSAAKTSGRPFITGDVAIDGAWTEPAVARSVEFLRLQRGGSLTWLLIPRGFWVSLDDLLVEPQADPPAFRVLTESGPRDKGPRWKVQDLADDHTPAAELLTAGTRLELVGVVNRGLTSATIDELVFRPQFGDHAGKLISAGVVGRSPVHQGLAGALVVPKGDILETNPGIRDELLDLIEAALDEIDGFGSESSTDPAAAAAVASVP